MGRKSIVNSFIGKRVGGVVILRTHGELGRRQKVICKCLECNGDFIAIFHNVYMGKYKSCGCLQHAYNTKNPRWKGHGEISKSFFYSIGRGAKIRNLSFKISIEYIWSLFLLQDRKCRLSGENLTFQKNRIDTSSNASLDRINSEEGYEEGNVQWVSKKVNYMKQQMDNREFLDKIREIYLYNLKTIE